MYIKKTVIAGDLKIIKKYHSSRYRDPNSKVINISEVEIAPREKPSKEQMEKINERNAMEKLWHLFCANFKKGDLHLVLTYFKEKRLSSLDAGKALEKFLRKCRDYYKKIGKEFKYIAVTEYENNAVHHHIAIKRCDISALAEFWTYGSIKSVVMYTADLKKLSDYFVKETNKTFRVGGNKKRWSASRNLKKPYIKREIIHANTFRQEIKPEKGYYIDKDSIECGICEYTGFEYQRYTMIKINTKSNKGDGKMRVA